MSFATSAYQEVDTIVSSWTKKYQHNIQLLESKSNMARFAVQFSLTSSSKPIPIGTVKVYFTCHCHQQITFRFEKDSLIHEVDKTVRHGELERWIDEALGRKLLVRQKVFYLGTAYEETRVKDQRLDWLLYKPFVKEEEEYVFIHPDLLADQERSIEIMEIPKRDIKLEEEELKKHFRQVDTENIGIITRPELITVLKTAGISLNAAEEKQVLVRVDPDDTGMVEYRKYSSIMQEILEALQAKKSAQSLLQNRQDNEEFFAVLCFLNDEAYEIENQIIEQFTKQDEDQTGLTNISTVKRVLEDINKSYQQQNIDEPISPLQLAEITKILNEKYGIKDIPYANIHENIISYKINKFSNGLTKGQTNKLELYIRELCDKFDEKKFGRIHKNDFIKAIQSSPKIKLTKAHIYVLESILPLENNQINYVQSSKFLAEVIKKFYIYSSKKQSNL